MVISKWRVCAWKENKARKDDETIYRRRCLGFTTSTAVRWMAKLYPGIASELEMSTYETGTFSQVSKLSAALAC